MDINGYKDRHRDSSFSHWLYIKRTHCPRSRSWVQPMSEWSLIYHVFSTFGVYSSYLAYQCHSIVLGNCLVYQEHNNNCNIYILHSITIYRLEDAEAYLHQFNQYTSSPTLNARTDDVSTKIPPSDVRQGYSNNMYIPTEDEIEALEELGIVLYIYIYIYIYLFTTIPKRCPLCSWTFDNIIAPEKWNCFRLFWYKI